MTEQMCPIWNRTAVVGLKPGYRDLYEVNSPRAGGKYEITSSAMAMAGGGDQDFLLKATEFITRSNLARTVPVIHSPTLTEIDEIALPWVGERAERLLTYLETRTSTLGENLGFAGDDLELLQAVSASIGENDLTFLLRMLKEQGFVDLASNGDQFPAVQIVPNGYVRLHELRHHEISSTQVFVAMWFHDNTEKAYSEGIKLGIEDAGYVPMRIDRKEHINKIDDEIIAEIRRSKFVVADFTSEPEKPRGGVYFEAGFAKGLGREVIWTCKKDCLDHVHLDTRQYNHIVWETPGELRKALEARISAVFGDGPQKRKQD
jgi:nucleoside 2-deoxyribosyltransferase